MKQPVPSCDSALSDLIISSYRRIVGQALLPRDVPKAAQSNWLYKSAPFCVLAHNHDSDPLFIYANETAQRCFEYSLAEFLTLPSRLSAEAPDRVERQRLLDAVTKNGFATGYTGLRVAKSGRRFWIENGIVWQLTDDQGAIYGQAATFNHWRDAKP